MKENNNIPSMTPERVLAYLREVGCGWSGQGVAVELGSWLGATAAPLLEGLVEAGYDKNFWAFDWWNSKESEVDKAKKQGVSLYVNQDLRPMFLENITSIYPKVKAIKGKIPATLHNYSKEPIEICLFDAPKRDYEFNRSMEILSPYFIPGVTVIGLMDYYFYERKTSKSKIYETMAPVRYMKKYSDNYKRIKEWPTTESVFFKYIKKIGG